MKKILSVVLAVVCLFALCSCGYPSKSTVEDYASQVLEAIVDKNYTKIGQLAHPDYAGYFTEEELTDAFAQYEEWGICNGDASVGTLKRTSWMTSSNYYGDKGSEAWYTVSIGGIKYEFEIVIVENSSGTGLANFELAQVS